MNRFRVVKQPFSARQTSRCEPPRHVDFKPGEQVVFLMRDGPHAVFAYKSDVNRTDRPEYFLDSETFVQLTADEES